jgi:hypothetical protein
MLQLSESDKVTVWDTVQSSADIGNAVAFVRTKYQCGEDEAVEAVDEVVSLQRGTPNTEPDNDWDGMS